MTKREPNSAIIRVHKTEKFATIPNQFLLYEKPPMSLKAKGLLSIFLALPPTWNYSISGIASICKESRDCIRSTMAELTERGYLKIEKQNGENGRFIYIYHIFDEAQKLSSPDTENPHLENPTPEIPKQADPHLENSTELNTYKKKTKKQKCNKQKEEKKLFGEFLNVSLTEIEIEKLKTLYITEENFKKAIEILSSYKASSGKKYKSDYAVLNKSNWIYPKIFPNQEQSSNQAVTPFTGGKYSSYHSKQEGMQ